MLAVHFRRWDAAGFCWTAAMSRRKPFPGDYDACWDPDGIDLAKLDPVFDDFDNGGQAKKTSFGGEFVPVHVD